MIVIVGFISLLLGNVFSSLKLIGSSSHEGVAKEIITTRLEKLRSSGYDNLANGSSTITDTRLSSLPAATSQVLIEDCPINICANFELLKQVTLRVSWNETKTIKNVTLVTFIGKGGVQ